MGHVKQFTEMIKHWKLSPDQTIHLGTKDGGRRRHEAEGANIKSEHIWNTLSLFYSRGDVEAFRKGWLASSPCCWLYRSSPVERQSDATGSESVSAEHKETGRASAGDSGELQNESDEKTKLPLKLVTLILKLSLDRSDARNDRSNGVAFDYTAARGTDAVTWKENVYQTLCIKGHSNNSVSVLQHDTLNLAW